MKINIAAQTRKAGSFLRDPEKKDVVDTFFSHKGIFALYGRNEENRHLQDWAAQQLVNQKQIDQQTVSDYRKQVYALFNDAENADKRSVEQMDEELQLLRCKCFGVERMEALQQAMMQEHCDFQPEDGIDQRAKKETVLKNASAVIFICDEARLSSVMRSDVQAALQADKEVYVLAQDKQGQDIPTEVRLKAYLGDDGRIKYLRFSGNFADLRAQDISEAKLLNVQIALGKALLLYYGESGLCICRDLLLDAIVHAFPKGYYARALTNQFDVNRACVVYVPKGMDVTPWVPLREQSRLSYHHLFTLWQTHGDEIYTYSPEELYRRYPQHFLNIYDNNTRPVEVTTDYPIRLSWEAQTENAQESVMEQYDMLREQALAAYLDNVENLEYHTGYLDEEYRLQPVNYEKHRKREGVMVHSVKVKKADNASVLGCERYSSLRTMIRQQMSGGCEKLRIYSNFLFFLTPVIARVHNALRSDRPREQIDFDKSHVDYMLLKSEDKRTETFPLYKKACIAMKSDGTFLFFNFRLGGGQIRIGKTAYRWSREDVDPKACGDRSVCVFTPFLSNQDLQENAATYVKPVGEGRINLVMIQDRLICMRKGAVLLPCMGVVISLDEATGRRMMEENALCLGDDDYLDGLAPTVEVMLDPPEGISPVEWEQVVWAYGGGMSLILDGRSICDTDGSGMLKCLEAEGWMSPLSQQTQESGVHRKERHPRTAIGVTNAGELLILVYSGRTRRSGGADYDQMIAAAKKMYPDIKNLMNVDGGGSSVLGMSIGDGFMELSYPSTSLDSCAGMVRPINTVFCIEMT